MEYSCRWRCTKTKVQLVNCFVTYTSTALKLCRWVNHHNMNKHGTGTWSCKNFQSHCWVQVSGQLHLLPFSERSREGSPVDFRAELNIVSKKQSRSQWTRGLRRRSAAARLLILRVRIPPRSWISVCCECCVLSGRGLCDELITHPVEYNRSWCVVVCDLETSWMRRP